MYLCAPFFYREKFHARMNVTTTKTGDLGAVLTVTISPEDYREKVESTLKDYRRKANIPGFRPGKVPASLIRKQYAKPVLIEEVNHLLQHAVYDHIQKEDMDILGNPLPVPNDSIDWEQQEEFSFEFELGLSPDFDLKLDDKTKVPYYKIEADKAMVDRYVTDYAKRFGNMSFPDAVEEDSIVKAIFTEVDEAGSPIEDGISHEGSFRMEQVEDKDVKKKLTGKKIGEKVEVDINKTFSPQMNLVNLLDTTTEKLEASTGRFELDVIEISKLNPGELNQELFDKVFGEGEVSSEEEFRQRVKEDAEKMFVGESDRKFMEDLKEVVLSKTDIELPDEFLKKWMQTNQEKPVSEQEVEEEYPKMKDGLKWQLVENRVIKENDIQAEEAEIVDYTKQLVARQMMQYGQQPDEDQLNNIAQQVLSNREEGQRITDQLYTEKLLKFYKDTVKLDEKKVTFDEFLKEVNQGDK